jgi:PBP1b-binding outer membrane lipoprotein LpoB
MKTTIKAFSALASVIVAASLLSGCSAVAAVANAQTKVQACTAIAAQLKGVGTGIQGEVSKLQSDPKAAAVDITGMAKKFSTAAGKLNNPQVRKAAVKAAGTLTVFAQDITDLANKPTTAESTKLQGDLTTLQSAFTAIDTTCKV